jgi:uncharacterized membrane protein YfcA
MNVTLMPVLVFIVAALYSSAGFGGASGYLIVMNHFSVPANIMASTALLSNIMVSSISFTSYHKVGHYRLELLVPFLVTSIPAAFFGGWIELPSRTYSILLYAVLAYLAVRMVFFPALTEAPEWTARPVPTWAALASGAGIGLLSGMLGIGGGIFLSPLIILMSWGNSKQAAASACGFIAINSLSGLMARAVNGTFEISEFGIPMLIVGLLGASLGGLLGSSCFSSAGVRRVLGMILAIAGGTFWISFFR